MTAQDYLNEIQNRGTRPNFQQQVTQAYQDPVLKPIIQEGADLQSQYLPAVFKPFTEMGTGASDLSPAAKLAMIGSSVGRLGGRIKGNNDIQNFYQTQIGQVAQGLGNDWQAQNDNLWKMYTAKAAQENADRQFALASAPPPGPQFPGSDTPAAPAVDRNQEMMAANFIRAGKALRLKGDTNYNSGIWKQITQGLIALGYDPNKIDYLNAPY